MAYKRSDLVGRVNTLMVNLSELTPDVIIIEREDVNAKYRLNDNEMTDVSVIKELLFGHISVLSKLECFQMLNYLRSYRQYFCNMS